MRGQAPSVPNPSNVLKGHTETIYSLVFSPNGKQIVTGSFDKTVKVWDATTGKEIRTLTGPQGHKQMVLNVAISPDGSLIASGSSDNTANLWDYPMSDPLKNGHSVKRFILRFPHPMEPKLLRALKMAAFACGKLQILKKFSKIRLF